MTNSDFSILLGNIPLNYNYKDLEDSNASSLNIIQTPLSLLDNKRSVNETTPFLTNVSAGLEAKLIAGTLTVSENLTLVNKKLLVDLYVNKDTTLPILSLNSSKLNTILTNTDYLYYSDAPLPSCAQFPSSSKSRHYGNSLNADNKIFGASGYSNLDYLNSFKAIKLNATTNLILPLRDDNKPIYQPFISYMHNGKVSRSVLGSAPASLPIKDNDANEFGSSYKGFIPNDDGNIKGLTSGTDSNTLIQIMQTNSGSVKIPRSVTRNDTSFIGNGPTPIVVMGSNVFNTLSGPNTGDLLAGIRPTSTSTYNLSVPIYNDNNLGCVFQDLATGYMGITFGGYPNTPFSNTVVTKPLTSILYGKEVIKTIMGQRVAYSLYHKSDGNIGIAAIGETPDGTVRTKFDDLPQLTIAPSNFNKDYVMVGDLLLFLRYTDGSFFNVTGIVATFTTLQAQTSNNIPNAKGMPINLKGMEDSFYFNYKYDSTKTAVQNNTDMKTVGKLDVVTAFSPNGTTITLSNLTETVLNFTYTGTFEIESSHSKDAICYFTKDSGTLHFLGSLSPKVIDVVDGYTVDTYFEDRNYNIADVFLSDDIVCVITDDGKTWYRTLITSRGLDVATSWKAVPMIPNASRFLLSQSIIVETETGDTYCIRNDINLTGRDSSFNFFSSKKLPQPIDLIKAIPNSHILAEKADTE